MARRKCIFAAFFLAFVSLISPSWSLKCRADEEMASEEDYREAVRVCMSNITRERDEQGYNRPGEGAGGGPGQGGPMGPGGGGSGGGGRRPHRGNRGDRHNNDDDVNSGSGGGSRRPIGRPSGRPGPYGGMCEAGPWNGGSGGGGGGSGGSYGGNNGGGYGGGSNSNGYGGNSGGGGYGGGYGAGFNGGGYGGGMNGYGGPQHRNRGPVPGGTVLQGGPVGAGPMAGGMPLTGHPRSRRASYGGNRDGRISTALYNVDACIVHCIFRQMQMLNDNARPDKDAIISVMTQRVRDRELREFIQDSVHECFDISQSESSRSLNKCDFAKTLALCLEEKAKRHCDDWEEDGVPRDQRGDRGERGSSNQRPPRQHYVGR